MGQLHYSGQQVVQIDDRLLGHLEATIISKLRRNEAFALRLDGETGIRTLWVNASSQIIFSYDGERPSINRAWLEILVETANTPAGLRLLPEPGGS